MWCWVGLVCAEAVTVAFEILEVLAESEKSFLTAHLPVLVKIMLEVCGFTLFAPHFQHSVSLVCSVLCGLDGDEQAH